VAPFELVAPATVDEAFAALRTAGPSGVGILAGGTDLLLDIDEARFAPTRLVSLRRLPWRTLDWVDGALTIGSTLPLRTVEDDPDVRRRLPGLWQAVRAVGSVALRHRATLGGNLGRAAPASDLIPMLLALDAEVELVGPAGVRRLPLDAFVLASRRTALGPAELIRSVRIPEARPSAYLWQRVRPANDISQLAVAVAFAPSTGSWRVAVGGVPPRSVLLPEVAAALGTRPPAESAVRVAEERAAREVAIVADRRASEEYRRKLVGTLLRRAVALAGGSDGEGS
jgi:CO/xanthine dehydrogenase FAD-binding subunit